jgi:hypothetical protein
MLQMYADDGDKAGVMEELLLLRKERCERRSRIL